MVVTLTAADFDVINERHLFVQFSSRKNMYYTLSSVWGYSYEQPLLINVGR